MRSGSSRETWLCSGMWRGMEVEVKVTGKRRRYAGRETGQY